MNAGQKEEIMDYGTIKLFKSTLPPSENLQPESVSEIREKVVKMKKIFVSN